MKKELIIEKCEECYLLSENYKCKEMKDKLIDRPLADFPSWCPLQNHNPPTLNPPEKDESFEEYWERWGKQYGFRTKDICRQSFKAGTKSQLIKQEINDLKDQKIILLCDNGLCINHTQPDKCCLPTLHINKDGKCTRILYDERPLQNG